jgi:hypothetical protein
MIDVSLTTAPKSEQINADDLIGGPRTIRVRHVKMDLGEDQPISIYFDGDDNKPFRPCKSMRRVLIAAWGRDGKTYAGKSMILYCDPSVMFGGAKVGGIRISHLSHIDKPITMALTVTRASRKPYTVKPLQIAPSTPVDGSAPEPAAGSVASAAAGLNEQIGACKTEAELKGWHDKNKSGFGMLEAETFEAVKAAYQRRKRELADDREMVA